MKFEELERFDTSNSSARDAGDLGGRGSVEDLKGEGGGTGVRGARIPSEVSLLFDENRGILSNKINEKIERMRDTRGTVVGKAVVIGEFGLSGAISEQFHPDN